MVCAPVRSIIPSLKLGIISPYRCTNHALSLTKIISNITITKVKREGRGGGRIGVAMVLGKLLMPGRPTKFRL